jgi:hypothetical protein
VTEVEALPPLTGAAESANARLEHQSSREVASGKGDDATCMRAERHRMWPCPGPRRGSARAPAAGGSSSRPEPPARQAMGVQLEAVGGESKSSTPRT